MKNQLKTVVFLGVLTAILMGVGALVAPGHIYVFGAIAIAMNLFSYFFSDKIVLKMHRARPVTPEEEPSLHRMVDELARKAGIPKPKVYVIDEPMPNAFATGRNPKHGVVAVTTGIRRTLSERELKGVIAHELAHIRNRDILICTIAAMAASIVSMVASIARWGLIFGAGRSDDDREGGHPAALLILAIVAPIAATLVQLAISRSREYLADQSGGEISGDPDSLADALLRLERGVEAVPYEVVQTAPATASLFIVNPLRGGGVLSLFSTHPSTEDRVRRLREQSRRMRGAA